MTAGAGKLVLVRHGQTYWNRNRYLGWANPRLNRDGLRQAAAVSDALEHERIDRIDSSPLLRALQTALPLASQRGLEIHLRPELREINYGDYEGVRKEPGVLKLRRTHRYEPVPGGESLYDLYRRIRPFSEELGDLLRGGAHVAVVGHFWSNRLVIGCLAGTPFDAILDAPAYKPANGSILEVTCGGAATRGVSVLATALRPQAEEPAS